MTKWAFFLSRSLFDSEIRCKPPEYIKVWIYLLWKANHKTNKYRWYIVDRWQCFVDYKELLEQIEYNIWYRKKKYHESFMKDCMKRLRSTWMITTVKQPRWVLVTIINYWQYQDLKSYEATNETTYETTNEQPMNNQWAPSINNNDKNDNNENKINKYIYRFDDFRKIYPKKKWKPKAEIKYKEAIRWWATHEQIIKWVTDYLQEIRSKNIQDEYIKRPQWRLSEKRRLDDYETEYKPASNITFL